MSQQTSYSEEFRNFAGKIPLVAESFSYITVAGQMAGKIIKKRSSSQIVSCKFCEVFQKRLSQSASCLTASEFHDCFRRLLLNTCLALPKIVAF